MAQTLKFGTDGNWATKKGSTLAYNDQNDRFKPLPFTTTRATGATRVNKEGLIEVVSNDVPRIDYTDSADGALLLENSSTNLVTYSEDFSNWFTNGSATSSINTLISPNGTLNADTLNAAISNYSGFNKRFTSTIGSSYTNSVFFKKGTQEWVGLVKNDGSAMAAWFNLSNGTIGTVESGVDAKIKDYGNGWYRCSITMNATITDSYIQIAVVDYNNSISNSVVGGAIYAWGAQVEANSYPTSYIPTNGSAVTRVADTASGAGNSEVFNDSEGVFYINTASLSNDGTNRQISISDGNTSQRVYFGFRANSNEFILSSRDSSYLIANVSDVTNFNKYVFQYKSGNFKAFVNGFNYVLNADGGLLPTGLNTLNFDDGRGVADYFGKTKELGYYNTALTDEELEYMTSYRTLRELAEELNLNKL
jgi:hypothetical protein